MIGNIATRGAPASTMHSNTVRRIETLCTLLWPWSAITQERQRADAMQRLLRSATDAAVARGQELNAVLWELDQTHEAVAAQKVEIAILRNERDATASQCRQMQKSIAAAITHCDDAITQLTQKSSRTTVKL